MNKKAIAILGGIFILISGTLGFLIYSKYSKKSDTPPVAKVNPTPPASPTPVQPPPAPTTPPPTPSPSPNTSPDGKIFKLTDDKVISPALFFDGTGITYFDEQGQLFQSALQDTGSGPLQLARKHSLDITTKSGISKILWPPQGDSFMAQFGISGKKTWSFYNSKTGVYTNLPEQISTLDWNTDGQKIYYIWAENNKTNLSLSDPDSKNWKKISDIWALPDEIKVSPDGLNILYYKTKTASSTNPIYLTTPDGKVWQTLVKTGNNLGAIWSPDSQKFIFAKKDTNTEKFGLWYYNFFTGEVKDLKLSSLTTKVVWDKNSRVIYVAVPKSGIAGEDSQTTDTFVKFDTDSLEKTEFTTGNLKVDGEDMFLSKSSDKLFFRNAQDGSLYYLDLK